MSPKHITLSQAYIYQILLQTFFTFIFLLFTLLSFCNGKFPLIISLFSHVSLAIMFFFYLVKSQIIQISFLIFFQIS